MATMLNVPGFNEDVDPTDPGGAARKVVGMIGGTALGLVALKGGQFIFNEASSAAGQQQDGEGVDFV